MATTWGSRCVFPQHSRRGENFLKFELNAVYQGKTPCWPSGVADFSQSKTLVFEKSYVKYVKLFFLAVLACFTSNYKRNSLKIGRIITRSFLEDLYFIERKSATPKGACSALPYYGTMCIDPLFDENKYE